MDPFLGEIKLFAGNFAPIGWNLCDGTLLPISENDALYTLLGTTYGGDGQTTFAVPDLRGRVPMHQDSSVSRGSYPIGQTGGMESVTLSAQNMPSHQHALACTTAVGTTNDPTGNVIATAPSDCKVFAPTASDTSYNAAHVGSAGGSTPHDNMQPSLAITYIIATAGIYPPQS